MLKIGGQIQVGFRMQIQFRFFFWDCIQDLDLFFWKIDLTLFTVETIQKRSQTLQCSKISKLEKSQLAWSSCYYMIHFFNPLLVYKITNYILNINLEKKLVIKQIEKGPRREKVEMQKCKNLLMENVNSENRKIKWKV